MIDEESEGVPRRRLLGFLGGTAAAGAVGAVSIKYIVDNVLTPDGSRGDGGDPNTALDYPGHSDEVYDDWEDAIPEDCELSSSYETAVEQKVDEYDELDGNDLTEYVNTGRVQFRRGESEIYMLVDADGDGQYDDKGHSIPDVC